MLITPRALLPQLDTAWGTNRTHGLTLWVCAVGWDRALLPQLGGGESRRHCLNTHRAGTLTPKIPEFPEVRDTAALVRVPFCARIEKDHGLAHMQVRHRLKQAKIMLVAFTLREIGRGDIAKMLA